MKGWIGVSVLKTPNSTAGRQSTLPYIVTLGDSLKKEVTFDNQHFRVRRLLVVVDVLGFSFCTALFLQLMAHALMSGFLVVPRSTTISVVFVRIQNIKAWIWTRTTAASSSSIGIGICVRMFRLRGHSWGRRWVPLGAPTGLVQLGTSIRASEIQLPEFFTGSVRLASKHTAGHCAFELAFEEVSGAVLLHSLAI